MCLKSRGVITATSYILLCMSWQSVLMISVQECSDRSILKLLHCMYVIFAVFCRYLQQLGVGEGVIDSALDSI